MLKKHEFNTSMDKVNFIVDKTLDSFIAVREANTKDEWAKLNLEQEAIADRKANVMLKGLMMAWHAENAIHKSLQKAETVKRLS